MPSTEHGKTMIIWKKWTLNWAIVVQAGRNPYLWEKLRRSVCGFVFHPLAIRGFTEVSPCDNSPAFNSSPCMRVKIIKELD